MNFYMKLIVGSKAPEFRAPDQSNKMHQLSHYRGKYVLLYFYPKDDTPGCAKEACAFQGAFPNFKKIKAIVLGISVDSAESHKKFAKKYNLSFPLLSDGEKKVVKLYGVWGKKRFMGKTYNGTKRTSFLIGPEGKITKIYLNVKPPLHAKQVFEDLLHIASSARMVI